MTKWRHPVLADALYGDLQFLLNWRRDGSVDGGTGVGVESLRGISLAVL